MAVGRAPLSVEDILAKQKQDKEQAAKPKFLTKAERQALAVQRREEEMREQRAREDREREERERFEMAAREAAQPARGMMQQGRQGRQGQGYGYGNGQGQGQGHYNDRFGNAAAANRGRGGQAAPTAPRGPRGSAPPSGPRASAAAGAGYTPSPLSQPSSHVQPPPLPQAADLSNAGDRTMPPAELEIIRARYLGSSSGPNGSGLSGDASAGKKPRARRAGAGGDKKFVFDWDEADDTSALSLPLLNDPSASRVGGGAGYRTGGQQMQAYTGSGTVGTTFGGRLAGYDEGGSFRRGGASAAVVGGGAGVAGTGPTGAGKDKTGD
ncbi:hypothetical protein QFC19_002790 [Naganishia cerealis]|uniref:Uncharacterized protein n=1 Tax=Naganishia cerealis TaxID=610337 RepID=A0ACC2W7R2_9TREE|nr:hypothetical protein QFC19_002790 [Naganishia cerealis]